MKIIGDYIEQDIPTLVEDDLVVVEPVSWQEMKAHLRLWSDDEQDLVMAYVHAARIWAEKYTQRAFVAKEVAMYYDEIGKDYILKYPANMDEPIVVKLDGEILLDPLSRIELRKGPGLDYVHIPSDMITGDIAQITIEYVAEQYPRVEACKAAIMLMSARTYSSRESLETRNPHNAVKNILNFHRIKYR
jgi:hypothetical protein